jgi:trigger factor
LEAHKVRFPGSKVELRFLFEADEIDDVYDKVFRELSDRGGIRGFRPGKAPAKIVRRNYEQEIIQQMAWMGLIEDYCNNIIEEKGIEPLEDPTFPDLEELRLAENKPLAFTISFIVRPIPEIGQYKGVHIFKPSAEVTEEDIDNELLKLQQDAAEEVEPDRDEIRAGDMVTATVTVKPVGADETLEEGEEDFEIGSGRYTPPIDVEMIGKKVGDTVAVEHTYPEDYEDPELAGKNVIVAATIGKIVELKLPEINDEFAKSIGEFADLDDLRSTLRDQVAKELREWAESEAESNALAVVMAHADVDLPPSLVARAAALSFEQFKADLEREKLSIEEFTDISQTTEEELRANEIMRATTRLRFSAVIDEIRRREEIEIEAEDFDAAIAAFAADADVTADFVRQSMVVQEDLEEQLRERALRDKTIAFIVANCEVEEVPREQYEDVKERAREKLFEEVGNEAAQQPEEAGPQPDAEGATPQQDRTQPEQPDDALTTDEAGQ